MNDITQLTLAFLQAHPADAARILERLPARDSAALLGSLPVRLTAPVIRYMLPYSASLCIALLDENTAAGLIQNLGPQSGAAVLRDLPAVQRGALLKQLPTHTSLVIRLLLGYPDDTVGAYMTPTALAFSPETRIEETLERLRQSPDEAGCYLYVVDGDKRLLGFVPLAEAVRSDPAKPVSQIMTPGIHALPARTALASIRGNEAWDDFQTLPVVERKDRFVGVLHRSTLVRALAQRHPAEQADVIGDGLTGLVSAYVVAAAGLTQTIVELFFPAALSRTAGDRNER